MIRNIVFGGLHWGPPIWGKYHIEYDDWLWLLIQYFSGQKQDLLEGYLSLAGNEFAEYVKQIWGNFPTGCDLPED